MDLKSTIKQTGNVDLINKFSTKKINTPPINDNANQINSSLFAHKPNSDDQYQLNQQSSNEQNQQQPENLFSNIPPPPQINLDHQQNILQSNDLINETFPNITTSPYHIPNSINQLDSLLLSSEKTRPKRVLINVGGVKHEGR